jgi:integrase
MLIFPGECGQPMRPWTLTCTFQRILKHAGLPHLRFHDLRHTCATLMLCEGVHIKIVQELLGHADVTITLNTYSHVLSSMGGEVAWMVLRAFRHDLSYRSMDSRPPPQNEGERRLERSRRTPLLRRGPW